MAIAGGSRQAGNQEQSGASESSSWDRRVPAVGVAVLLVLFVMYQSSSDMRTRYDTGHDADTASGTSSRDDLVIMERVRSEVDTGFVDDSSVSKPGTPAGTFSPPQSPPPGGSGGSDDDAASGNSGSDGEAVSQPPAASSSGGVESGGEESAAPGSANFSPLVMAVEDVRLGDAFTQQTRLICNAFSSTDEESGSSAVAAESDGGAPPVTPIPVALAQARYSMLPCNDSRVQLLRGGHIKTSRKHARQSQVELGGVCFNTLEYPTRITAPGFIPEGKSRWATYKLRGEAFDEQIILQEQSAVPDGAVCLRSDTDGAVGSRGAVQIVYFEECNPFHATLRWLNFLGMLSREIRDGVGPAIVVALDAMFTSKRFAKQTLTSPGYVGCELNHLLMRATQGVVARWTNNRTNPLVLTSFGTPESFNATSYNGLRELALGAGGCTEQTVNRHLCVDMVRLGMDALPKYGTTGNMMAATKDARAFLRQELAAPDDDAVRVLIVLRRKRRRIVNEDAVVNAARAVIARMRTELGIEQEVVLETAIFESLRLESQLRAVSRARVFAGVQGAAFGFSYLMPEGSSLLEVNAPQHSDARIPGVDANPSSTFGGISRAAGVHHVVIPQPHTTSVVPEGGVRGGGALDIRFLVGAFCKALECSICLSVARGGVANSSSTPHNRREACVAYCNNAGTWLAAPEPQVTSLGGSDGGQTQQQQPVPAGDGATTTAAAPSADAPTSGGEEGPASPPSEEGSAAGETGGDNNNEPPASDSSPETPSEEASGPPEEGDVANAEPPSQSPNTVGAPTADSTVAPVPGCAPDAPVNLPNYRPVAPVTREATAVFYMNKFFSFGACLSVATAAHHGFKLMIVGLGFPHAGLKRPARMAQFGHEVAAQLPQDELIVLVDGGDTMVVRGPDELYERFGRVIREQRGQELSDEDLKAYTIVSSETMLSNLTVGEDEYFLRIPEEEQVGKWTPYPNTGVIVGYPAAVAALFAKVFDLDNLHKYTTLQDEIIDQIAFTAMFQVLELNKTCLVDGHSHVSLSMYRNSEKSSWLTGALFRNGMPPRCKRGRFKHCVAPMDVPYPERNVYSGSEPIIVHWNGPSKYKVHGYRRCYHQNREGNDWMYDVDDAKMLANNATVRLGDHCSLNQRRWLCRAYKRCI